MKKTIPAQEARQGRWGLPVLVVLVASLLLAAVVWVGVEIYGSTLPTEQTETTQPGNPQ